MKVEFPTGQVAAKVNVVNSHMILTDFLLGSRRGGGIRAGEFSDDLLIVLALRQPAVAGEHELLLALPFLNLNVSTVPRRTKS